MGEMGNAYKYFIQKPDVKRQCGRYRHRWKANIRLDPREIAGEFVDWMHLPQDRDQ
jgi:hypothetical protein